VREFEPKIYENATKSREKYGSTIGFNKDYRHGVIYGAYQKFDTVYQTVDVAIFTDDDTLILGMKNLHKGKYVFPGGFVDVCDRNLKEAVIREAKEETGLDIYGVEYLESFVVDDYRYRYETDGIMTHLHKAKAKEVNTLTASDDLDGLYRINLKNLEINDMADSHKPLAEHIIKYLIK
jgi:bifunctional NMN adenylyltransferase/nudix hydrolase